MDVRIEVISDSGEEEWESCVDRSPQTTVFHRYEALDVLAEYFDGAVHRLIGYVGQEPVGVFPVFELSRGPFLLVTSPPPGVEVNVGPALLNFQKLKQRKAEQRHQAFVDGCLDWISSELDPDYLKINTTDRYTDVRPFIRRGFDVTPSYTYVLDITPDESDLMTRFSRDARSNVRNTDDNAYDIQEGDIEELEAIVSLVQRRYAEQNEDHYLGVDLVTDLYSALDTGQIRPYVCRVDGQIVSGIIALEDDTTAYRWQGGAKRNVDLPVNDLLDWHVITAAKRRDRSRYDLVGAMLPRLCEYKSKFGPSPEPLYTIERRNFGAKVATETRKRLPNVVQELIGA